MRDKDRIKLILGIFLIILGFSLNYISANYIAEKYKDIVIEKNPDIFLNLFNKQHPVYMVLGEIFVIISVLLFIKFNYKEKSSLIEALVVFGIFNVVRGIFLPLTILGGLESYGLLSRYITFSYGLFPSGHTSIPFILFLTSKTKKVYFLILTLLVIAGLLISQQHYTIDILSSVIFIYAIKSFYEKHIG